MSELGKEFKTKLEKIAEDNDEKVEVVLLLFHALKGKILEEEPHLNEVKANIRTYNGLKNYYGDKKFNKGNSVEIIPMGVSQDPKDTNKKLRDEILKDFSNPQKRLEMIAGASGDGSDGKVMVMKISDAVVDNKEIFFTDVYKPVKSVQKLTKMSNNEYVVVKGSLWEPGDKPVPRNYMKNIQYVEGGEIYPNRQWSRPLDANYKFVIFGLGMFEGMKEIKDKDGTVSKKKKNPIEDGLITRITFYGDMANPNHPKFAAKKNLWFKPCKLKAVDTKYSNDLFLQFTAKTDLDVGITKLKIPSILGAVNKRIKSTADKFMKFFNTQDLESLPKEKARKLKELDKLYKKFLKVDYIPVIDLNGINNYHMTHRALLDEDGSPIKDESGTWDNIDFDSFAVCECALTGFYKKDDKPPKMILDDYSMSDDESVFAKYSTALDSEIQPSTVYISLTTSRGNSAYDPETEKYIVDPDNARAMPKIKGLGTIMDFNRIDIDKLRGDL